MLLRRLGSPASKAQLLLQRRLSVSTSKPSNPLVTSAAVFGAANALGFATSIATGWHYHLDLIGTGAFTAAAVATAGTGCSRQRLSAGFVGLW